MSEQEAYDRIIELAVRGLSTHDTPEAQKKNQIAIRYMSEQRDRLFCDGLLPVDNWKRGTKS